MLKYRATPDKQADSSPSSHPDNMPHAQAKRTSTATEEARARFSMNAVIGWILQGGVLISAAVICIGIILLLVHPGHGSSQQLFVFPHTLSEVGSGLLVLHPQAFIALGLLLLIATPVVRVAASIFAFALEHDRRYVAITLVVLTILLVSFLLGKGAG